MVSPAMLKSLITVSLGLTLALAGCGGSQGTSEPPDTPPAEPKSYDKPPAMAIDTGKQYTATIVTAKGDIIIGLFAADAPKTVNNFVFLARDGYYDGSTFHRVIPGFMAQGGDPTGTGRGGPGYTFADEFSAQKHGVGTLSMANRGPDTNGSQFFITYAAQPGLDNKHAVFGRVIGGMDVLNNLTPRDPSQNPDFTGDVIVTITITEGG